MIVVSAYLLFFALDKDSLFGRTILSCPHVRRVPFPCTKLLMGLLLPQPRVGKFCI